MMVSAIFSVLTFHVFVNYNQDGSGRVTSFILHPTFAANVSSFQSPSCPVTPTKFNASNPTATAFDCPPSSSPNVNCEKQRPGPKKINGNHMTGTKQLLGHGYHLLHLLRQMINSGRSNPTNSTGKKSLLETITGSQIETEFFQKTRFLAQLGFWLTAILEATPTGSIMVHLSL